MSRLEIEVNEIALERLQCAFKIVGCSGRKKWLGNEISEAWIGVRAIWRY